MNLKSIATTALAVLLFGISYNANAQDQRFRIGMKFSGNLSWISPVTKNIDKVGTSGGYSYGIMGDYNFQKYYALSAELLLTDISGSIVHTDLLKHTDTANGTTSHSNVQYDYRTTYVQLPISFKYQNKRIWVLDVLGTIWYGTVIFDERTCRHNREYSSIRRPNRNPCKQIGE